MEYSVEEIERHLKRWDTSDETEGIIRQLLDERKEMEEIITAAKEVRINIAGLLPEIQKIINSNGWLTVLRNNIRDSELRRKAEENKTC